MKIRMTPRNTEPYNHFIHRLSDKLLENGVDTRKLEKDSKGNCWCSSGYANEYISNDYQYTKNWNVQTIITIKQTNA